MPLTRPMEASHSPRSRTGSPHATLSWDRGRMAVCRSEEGGNVITVAPRALQVRHALLLEYGTVGWNVVEGLVAVAAALSPGSIALLGFGVDSFVETASGAILIWRLRAEGKAEDEKAIEQLDRRAHQLAG